MLINLDVLKMRAEQPVTIIAKYFGQDHHYQFISIGDCLYCVRKTFWIVVVVRLES